ncbi:hypothetical protein [Sphingomonas alba]|uniref:SPOR domain-containing protein n=1 Tax=Sphingomonas alba TaxID=2908208 RepID=A0ABT0RL29_9SPHN|nr:hypothetical protein [Sphingomonas alba]MCL6683336.1 hypothetical protein [Sphingomonas alba]
MHGHRPVDEDRLPWLEPYRETKATAPPQPRSRSGRPLLAIIGLILLAAVGGGGYWLGQQKEAPQPQPSQTVAIAPARPVAQVVEVAQAPVAAPAVEAPGPATVPVAKAKAPRKAVHHRAAPARRKIRTAGVERAHIDAVRAEQERLAKSRPWPKMPSPGPAGQVIQLGAFTTAARANNAYSSRVARYPVLGRMPKVVVPVITKPDGRILYVLRLGTSSRQQSKTVCRNLQRSGDHCLVIG